MDAGNEFELKTLGAGLATIALAGVGAGIGIVFGSLIHSVSPAPHRLCCPCGGHGPWPLVGCGLRCHLPFVMATAAIPGATHPIALGYYELCSLWGGFEPSRTRCTRSTPLGCEDWVVVMGSGCDE